jgi:hypothetical protein
VKVSNRDNFTILLAHREKEFLGLSLMNKLLVVPIIKPFLAIIAAQAEIATNLFYLIFKEKYSQ